MLSSKSEAARHGRLRSTSDRVDFDNYSAFISRREDVERKIHQSSALWRKSGSGEFSKNCW